MTTNHELNVEAAEAAKGKFGDLRIYAGFRGFYVSKLASGETRGNGWSPAESIEHAMGLLELLPDGESIKFSWRNDSLDMAHWRGENHLVEHLKSLSHEEAPWFTCEFFVAAKKAEASDGR